MTSSQTLAPHPDHSMSQQRRQRLSIAIAILLGFAISVSAYLLVRDWEQGVIDSEFERRANNHAVRLQSIIDQHVELLESLGGHYVASEQVLRSEFRRFVEPILARHPEVQGYSWNPLITHDNRFAFEAAVRQEGVPHFEIMEIDETGKKAAAKDREEYVAVLYIEPLSGNEQALGYDIASEKTRRKALDKARETGLPVATRWIRLIQEREEQYGVLFVKPVYARDASTKTSKWKNDSLRGYVVGVFRVGDMIEEALRPAEPAGLDFWVYQGTKQDPYDLSYFHPSRSRLGEDTAPRFSRFSTTDGRQVKMPLTLPGKQWTVVYRPAPAFLAAHSRHAATGVLLSGSALTAVLGVYLLSMIRESQRASSLNEKLADANRDLKTEVVERHEAEKALRESESYNQTLFDESPIGLMLRDMNGEIVVVNAAFAAIVGRSVEETKKLNYRDITEEQPGETRTDPKTQGQNGHHGPYEENYKHTDGHLVPVRVTGRQLHKDGSIYVLSSVEDITEHKRARARIDHMAFHDALTDLPNRDLLRDRLEHALQLARRNESLIGVMFLDIDRFKMINDVLGHNYGDQLLVQVSDRLTHYVREADTVARFGGDEFVIIVEGFSDREKIEKLARMIVEKMRQPFQISNRDTFITVSMGVSLGAEKNQSADALIAQADIAMYKAKEAGRDNYKVHSPDMGKLVSARAAIESDLRGALEREELLCHFQPILAQDGRKLVGMEALMRWNHPDRGLVPPADFIPVMEESGMIVPASRWILREACRFLSVVNASTHHMLFVSVNFSVPCFYDPGIADFVRQTIADCSVQPSQLVIEVTESTLFQDPHRVNPVMESLTAAGVQIALDDFGTGQSSLSHLRDFPIDIVKIDRAFIRDVPKDIKDCELVSGIIAMAHSLKKCVVAEGVETESQLMFLNERGCDRIQGYLFSPALADEEFMAYLEADMPPLAAVDSGRFQPP